jgi:hypothetical protein
MKESQQTLQQTLTLREQVVALYKTLYNSTIAYMNFYGNNSESHPKVEYEPESFNSINSCISEMSDEVLESFIESSNKISKQLSKLAMLGINVELALAISLVASIPTYIYPEILHVTVLNNTKFILRCNAFNNGNIILHRNLFLDKSDSNLIIDLNGLNFDIQICETLLTASDIRINLGPITDFEYVVDSKSNRVYINDSYRKVICSSESLDRLIERATSIIGSPRIDYYTSSGTSLMKDFMLVIQLIILKSVCGCTSSEVEIDESVSQIKEIIVDMYETIRSWDIQADLEYSTNDVAELVSTLDDLVRICRIPIKEPNKGNEIIYKPGFKELIQEIKEDMQYHQNELTTRETEALNKIELNWE